jgi:putative oxidoreductase
MAIERIVGWLIVWPERVFGGLASLLLLGVRFWVGWEFFKSGWLKITSWDSTLFLFQQEYHVPLLPSWLAAVVGTFGELAFPVLLFAGLAARLGALGLSAVNIMAVVSYAHVLLTEGFEAALGQHYLWGFALVVLLVFGPGRLSLDYLIAVNRAPGKAHSGAGMPMRAA